MKSKKLYPYFFWFVSFFVLLITVFRSYLVPFNHDEAATFFFYIQTGSYLPFHSHVDANNHVLNSLLGNICFHLFGTSPLSLRIPNILGLIILIIGVFKISNFFNKTSTKIFFTSALLLSFHWLSFFSVCRGYGISMALLVLGISFMLEYIINVSNTLKLVICLLIFQLAISANLILIIVVLLLCSIIFIIQLINKEFFKPTIILVWLLNFGAIYYWLKFSFYLQDNGALYYGEGDSYWKVSFESLILLITGAYSTLIKYLVLFFVLLFSFLFFYINKKECFKFLKNIKTPNFSMLFFLSFWLLVIGFYLMNKLLGVNYPEDRTGLFFYLFFILFISFTIDKINDTVSKVIGYGLSVFFALHFLLNINFRKHSLNVYETIPEHFYQTLQKEQEKTDRKITIGGHRVRELFYGFMNYRHGAVLNPADPVELMQMNCDYYLSTKAEEKYFKPYYDIIDTEPDWGFLLLKRKEQLIRNKIVEINNLSFSNNTNEFIELYAHGDTVFNNTNPLIAEIDINFEKVPVPINAWFVLQVNDSLDQTLYFKRYPLQWSGYNLNEKQHLNCNVTVGNLPKRSKKIACFIWNIEQKPLSFKVNSLIISQLEGKGVNFEAPDIK
jgi:hypothetical protein